jgi:hypothetical protein
MLINAPVFLHDWLIKASGDTPGRPAARPSWGQRRMDRDALLFLGGDRQKEPWGFDEPGVVILFCFAGLVNLN